MDFWTYNKTYKNGFSIVIAANVLLKFEIPIGNIRLYQQHAN
jgi:hypothetical protein